MRLRCVVREVMSKNKQLETVKFYKIAIIAVFTTLFILISYFMGGSSSRSMTAPVVINASAKHTATVSILRVDDLFGNQYFWVFNSQRFLLITEKIFTAEH